MLKCTSCNSNYENDTKKQRCHCGEPLEFELQIGDITETDSIWDRYSNFYEFKLQPKYSLGEGNTPLTRLNKLSSELGLNISVKNETVNPTWSFKDRGTFTGIHFPLNNSIYKIGTVSTGNMAVSVSAYGAYNNLDTFVLVNENISLRKLQQIKIYGQKVFKVIGDYGELYFKSLEISDEYGVYFINSDNPYRVEGYKTISFEIVEEKIPDYVFIPTSSGGMFRGIAKGFQELSKNGLLDKVPHLIAVQAEGCSPIYDAFIKGSREISPENNPNTIAGAIANPYPPSGNDVLRKIRKFTGSVISVNDNEIISAQKELAREGIYAQPAACVGVAGIKKMKCEIDKGSYIVSIVTGSGLKSDFKYGGSEVREIKIDELTSIF